MKQIDEMLNRWINNTIVREALRKLIIEYAQSAFQEGRGEDGFGDYS
tara:strand:+ start:529 stop:669 length:141 start_codon:yes stop_codon:yes gene_type:complete